MSAKVGNFKGATVCIFSDEEARLHNEIKYHIIPSGCGERVLYSRIPSVKKVEATFAPDSKVDKGKRLPCHIFGCSRSLPNNWLTELECMHHFEQHVMSSFTKKTKVFYLIFDQSAIDCLRYSIRTCQERHPTWVFDREMKEVCSSSILYIFVEHLLYVGCGEEPRALVSHLDILKHQELRGLVDLRYMRPKQKWL